MEEGERGVLAHFQDLHLDELEAALFAPHGEMGLEAIFRRPLQDGKAVVHRQRVAQDLEAEPLDQAFRTFFRGMENMRKGLELAEGARHPWQKRLYFLLAAEAYLEALEGLWKRRPKTAK